MATKKLIPLQLGCLVEDTVSGLQGIAIAHTRWITGCDTISIEPPAREGKRSESFPVDITRIKVLSEPKHLAVPIMAETKRVAAPPGGPKESSAIKLNKKI